MTRKEALAAGEMFYTGKVCTAHVELKGQRRTKSANCPLCIRDRMAKPEYRERTYARMKERRDAIKAGTYSPRPYRRASEVVT